MLRGRTSVLGVMLVLAAACGGSETAAPSSQSSTTATAPTPASEAPGATGTSPARTVVPDVVLRDVATGADVNLRGPVARPERPTLYWFWAPH